MIPFVSIIVPVYKVENYIERCARSLLNQSMQTVHSLEYIFVNDCTPDRSMEVLQRVIADYQPERLNIKIISHECNKGPGSARNTGLEHATGEYIFFCDSDDWLEPYAMELLWAAVQVSSADLIWFDWYLSFGTAERWMKESEEQTPLACLKSILSGKLKFNLWNKIVKRSLYFEHEVFFPETFSMAEDMIMIKMYAYVKSVYHVGSPLYHYMQDNSSSLTHTFTEKHYVQIRSCADEIIHFLRSVYEDRLDRELHYFKLNVKLPFLISADQVAYRSWLKWYEESNSYIWQNTVISFRVRLLQQMAAFRQFWFIRTHYYLLYQLLPRIRN